MKKKCLIIFAIPHVHNWENDVINKFKLLYDVEYVFANELFDKGGTQNIIITCNKIIKNEGIEIVVFDTDFLPFIDSHVIQSISNEVYKVLITYDSIVHDNLNIIHGSNCNLVLTGDSIDVFKLKEYNLNSLYFPLEGSAKIYRDLKLNKDIDVLFYGQLHKFGRNEFINSLVKRGVNIKIIGPPDNVVSNEKLVELINRSKIVLNFSYTDSGNINDNFFPLRTNYIKAPMLQLKGRFLQCGLCNTMCISEYAPSIELLCNSNEVPTFKTIDECEKLLNKFLKNDLLRNEIVVNLKNKCDNFFEDSVTMKKVFSEVENIKDLETLNFEYNSYYKNYITRFKILTTISKPVIFVREIHYLFINKLFSLSASSVNFIFRSIGSQIKKKLLYKENG